jgi:hypothetical protein
MKVEGCKVKSSVFDLTQLNIDYFGYSFIKQEFSGDSITAPGLDVIPDSPCISNFEDFKNDFLPRCKVLQSIISYDEFGAKLYTLFSK